MVQQYYNKAMFSFRIIFFFFRNIMFSLYQQRLQNWRLCSDSKIFCGAIITDQIENAPQNVNKRGLGAFVGTRRFNFLRRWLGSTSHKDIGTLYFFVGFFSTIMAASMSSQIRGELVGPGMMLM
jgi:hypothetical protein